MSTLPPCIHDPPLFICIGGIGTVPPPPIMIDLAKIPEPLTPEEAALVFRLEDRLEATAGQDAPAPAPAP